MTRHMHVHRLINPVSTAPTSEQVTEVLTRVNDADAKNAVKAARRV